MPLRACWGEWEEFGGRSAREEKERGRSGNASTVSTRNLSGWYGVAVWYRGDPARGLSGFGSARPFGTCAVLSTEVADQGIQFVFFFGPLTRPRPRNRSAVERKTGGCKRRKRKFRGDCKTKQVEKWREAKHVTPNHPHRCRMCKERKWWGST